MHNFLTEVTADCTDVLVVKPQKVMPNPGRKNQIVHAFEDGRNAVVAVSNTSIFEVELQWTYVSEEDRSTIFELFHASAKANGSARSFYWLNPVDGYVYTVRFLTPLRTVYKPGSLRSVETVRLRVDGIFGDHEYIIDLGDLHLATVDNGAMFFHDTEDFSVYAGASGNTPFRIVFTDSGGLTAEAWCGEVGGGETLGDQLVTNGDMETGDPPSNWSANGDNIITASTERTGGSGTQSLKVELGATNPQTWAARGSDLSVANGRLYNLSSWMKFESGTSGPCIRVDGTSTLLQTTSTSWIGQSLYRTFINSNVYIYLQHYSGSGAVGYFDDVSLKQVTDIPATGLKLYSAQNGTTQSMGTTDAGFNPNAIEKVDIYG